MLRSPRFPSLRLRLLLGVAMAALFVPTSAVAADRGEECKVGFGVANQYLCTGNTVCLRAVSKMYCSDPVKQCGWRNTGGFLVGQKKTYQGKTYECTTSGFELAKAGRGQECRVGPSVAQQYLCEPGLFCVPAINKRYCSNAGKACGWQNTGGYSLGQTRNYQNQEYECTPTGFKLQNAQIGEECRVGGSVPRNFLCETGKLCLQGVNEKYCSHVGRVCGWPGTGGYGLGQKKTQGNTTYECTATGFQPEDAGVTLGGGAITTVPATRPKSRRLNSAETRLAQQVFGRSLNLGQVRITNTLGAQSRPWTTNSPPVYTVNVGPVAYKNLATKIWGDLLIHELTHVWQGQHGVAFMANSAVHQTISAIQNGGDTGQAYDYTPGKQWGRYNSEQQASLVEDWFEDGSSRSSELYPYIRDNVRPGRPNATTNFK